MAEAGTVTLKFTKAEPGSFQTVVDEKIKEYFSKNGIAMTGNKKLYIKSAIIFTAFIVAYIAILTSTTLLGSQGNFVIFLWMMAWYVLLGFIIPGIGFNVMHDAVHGSYSHNKKVNRILGFWGGDAMGVSTFAWNIKHNVLHHTFTNIDHYDDDITQEPMFRLSPHQEWLPQHRYQHWYAKVLYCFLSLQWSLFNDYKKVVIHGKVLNRELKAKREDYVRFFIGKGVNLGIFILPAFFLPHWSFALIGFLVMHFITGYTLSIVFQMAHIVEGTSFVEGSATGKVNMSFKEHQVVTTANFGMYDQFLTWYVGGLNYQIEHHLFPKISHVHYPAISVIVQEVARNYNVEYNVFESFGSAKRSHFDHLKMLGQKPAQRA